MESTVSVPNWAMRPVIQVMMRASIFPQPGQTCRVDVEEEPEPMSETP